MARPTSLSSCTITRLAWTAIPQLVEVLILRVSPHTEATNHCQVDISGIKKNECKKSQNGVGLFFLFVGNQIGDVVVGKLSTIRSDKLPELDPEPLTPKIHLGVTWLRASQSRVVGILRR